MKNICKNNHRENNKYTLIPLSSSSVICTQCKNEFKLIDASRDKSKEIIFDFESLLESINVYYIDIPDDKRERIASLLSEIRDMDIADIYLDAVNNFRKYDPNNMKTI